VAGDNHADDANDAFQRAVNSERKAIKRHDEAAEAQDRWAARLEEHAKIDEDVDLQEAALQRAENARERAEAARDRAATARNRLISEGIDPDAPSSADSEA
jgi:predicted P-loop ATPase